MDAARDAAHEALDHLLDQLGVRLSDAQQAAALLHPLEAALLTSLAWLVALSLAAASWSWRGARAEHDDEAEGEVEADEAPESSEEKRLAFACLSGAIEEVQASVSEQQYLALYSAAVWCFNLTPHWAGSVPRPPSPPPDAAAPAASADEPGGTVRVHPLDTRTRGVSFVPWPSMHEQGEGRPIRCDDG